MNTATEDLQTPNALAPITPPAPPPPPDTVPHMDRVLGVVDLLSEAEQAQMMGCEAVVEMGWRWTFVEVGLALVQIRDGRLYRVDFPSFESYCSAKWQYGRHYVNRLISAAQVSTHLVTICHQCKPGHESQVRPLIGLAPEQAQAAWEHAVGKAGPRPHGAKRSQRAPTQRGGGARNS